MLDVVTVGIIQKEKFIDHNTNEFVVGKSNKFFFVSTIVCRYAENLFKLHFKQLSYIGSLVLVRRQMYVS